jgi:hypothetical protein
MQEPWRGLTLSLVLGVLSLCPGHQNAVICNTKRVQQELRIALLAICFDECDRHEASIRNSPWDPIGWRRKAGAETGSLSAERSRCGENVSLSDIRGTWRGRNITIYGSPSGTVIY